MTTEILKADTTLDHARINALTAGLRAEAERVRTLSIDDDAEEQEAGARLADVKRLDKDLKALIAGFKRPFLDVTQKVDKITKTGRDDVAALIGALTAVLGDYNVRKLEARREALAEAQAAAQQRDSRAATQALNARQANEKQKLAGVSVRLRWIATVVDADAVPRAWCCPDQSALSEHARQYAETDPPEPIPGVEFSLVGGSTLR